MLPEDYLAKMQEILKEGYEDYLTSFDQDPVKSLRANTSKISVNSFLDIFPYELEAIPWTDDGFYYHDDEVSKHPYHQAGLYYIQEASAMLPGEMLPVEKGDVVLDACAAPGGKSLKILNKLNGEGILIANDVSASRASALLRNIERQGFTNFFVTIADLKDLERKYPLTFDKILLDAPCSGEGMFRKDASLIKSWREKGNDYYSPIQKELIISALKMLKEGGFLLYSTCTFDPREDEEVILHALNTFDDLKIIESKMYPGFMKGKDGIGVKLYPHLVRGEGHFACLLQKGVGKKKEYIKKESPLPDLEFFKHVDKKFHDGSFDIIKDKLYFIPDFDTKGIRVLRSGLLLGTMNKYGFKPSQSLAQALKKEEFKNTYELDESQAIRYLKGETLNCDLALSGEYLICHDGFPLGFGKMDKGHIKNLIDKGWILR